MAWLIGTLVLLAVGIPTSQSLSPTYTIPFLLKPDGVLPAELTASFYVFAGLAWMQTSRPETDFPFCVLRQTVTLRTRWTRELNTLLEF